VDQVAAGDIAVCRRDGRLVCHRVIDKGILDGQPYIATRSDRNKKSDDPFTYDEDLLGIVIAIERNGCRLNPRDMEIRGASRFFLAMRRVLVDLYHRWRGSIFDVFSVVQRTLAYRIGFRLLSPAARRSARFEVRVWKEAWRKLGLYMQLKPEEFDMDGPALQGCASYCWTLALHLDSGNQPAAQATFLSGSENWHLDGFHVRSRYRGMGLEKDLLSKAKEIFNRNGITIFDLNGIPLE